MQYPYKDNAISIMLQAQQRVKYDLRQRPSIRTTNQKKSLRSVCGHTGLHKTYLEPICIKLFNC